MKLTPEASQILADVDCPLCMTRLGKDARVCEGCQTAFHAACLQRGAEAHGCETLAPVDLKLAPWQVFLIVLNLAIIGAEMCVFAALLFDSARMRARHDALRSATIVVPAGPSAGAIEAIDDRRLMNLPDRPALETLLSEERWLCRDLADILNRTPLLLRADTMLVIQCGLDPSLGGSSQFGHSHALGSMMALLALDEFPGGSPLTSAPPARTRTALDALSDFLARDRQFVHHALHEHRTPLGTLGEHPRLLHWMRGLDTARRAALAATQDWATGMTPERTQRMVDRARQLGTGLYVLRARVFGACPCASHAGDPAAGLELPLLLWQPEQVLAIREPRRL